MKLWIPVFFIFIGQEAVFSENFTKNNSKYLSKQSDQLNLTSTNVFSKISRQTTVSGIILLARLISISNFLNRRINPSTTDDDNLKLVRRLTDSLRPDIEAQFKVAEDSVSRALYDMITMTVQSPTELQRLLWLERTRLLDGDLILLLEGLLGQQVAGGDLMENIKDKFECDAVQIFSELNRYNDLITGGTIAFSFFSSLSGMSELETNLRKDAFAKKNVRVLERNIEVIKQCFQLQLSDLTFEEDELDRSFSSEQVAEQVANVMSNLYPLPIRWAIAVYTDERNTISRAAFKPIKPKLSANYIVKDINGYHVAIFPFFEGQNPRMIDTQLIDEFCYRPIIAIGKITQCNVGSSDGEYVYDELRRQGIVPPNLDLIVVPSEGKLSFKTVPHDSLSLFFAKKYPDFDIVIF